jgi:predicted nucleic acid-binding protein
LKRIERLAVDANPILSAIIGGSARTVFIKSEKSTAFYTTAFNYREVEKYIPIFASKRDIPIDDLYLAFSMLPLNVCDYNFYNDKVKQAKELIEKRDKDDFHLLALALKLSCPIWSNDKDFGGLGMEIYSTLDLIKERG